jgi:hypothetical protein
MLLDQSSLLGNQCVSEVNRDHILLVLLVLLGKYLSKIIIDLQLDEFFPKIAKKMLQYLNDFKYTRSFKWE